MSYNIAIGEYNGNITWNVMPMFDFAFTERMWRPETDERARERQRVKISEGEITRFKHLDGCIAEEILPFLEKALAHMDADVHRADYMSLNPQNGWGTHKRTLEVLTLMVEACREHPEERISIR